MPCPHPCYVSSCSFFVMCCTGSWWHLSIIPGKISTCATVPMENSAVLCFANCGRCLSYRTHSSIYNPSHCLTFHDTFTFALSSYLYASMSLSFIFWWLIFLSVLLSFLHLNPHFFVPICLTKMSFIQLKFHHLTSSTHTLRCLVYPMCPSNDWT